MLAHAINTRCGITDRGVWAVRSICVDLAQFHSRFWRATGVVEHEQWTQAAVFCRAQTRRMHTNRCQFDCTSDRQPRYLCLCQRPEALRPRLAAGLPLMSNAKLSHCRVSTPAVDNSCKE
jgi:hypothetical protein